MPEKDFLSETTGVELELSGIARRFGAFTAVDGIDLTVEPGEFMTLLGPSGSGKTTTLNMVAGFLPPDEGRISFDGRDVSRTPANRRNIGMVFQNYALFPTMTVRQNVGYPLRQRRVRGQARRTQVDAALEMVELGHLAHRRPSELSGGQQQRVALARALVHRPPLLLMDEPLGALDRRLREALQTEIASIHRQVGTTVVYVTHDQDEALSLSDRVAVFRAGRIEQVGTPGDVYERPRTAYVAGFVGDSNVFQGSVTGRGSLRLPGGQEVFGATKPGSVTTATMVVRPERMRVCGPSSAPLGTDANLVEGVLLDIRYLGATRLLRMQVGDGLLVLVREGAGHKQSLAIGSRVTACWDPSDAVWVDAPPSVDEEAGAYALDGAS